VAGGYGTNFLAYSSDGINWTPSASGNAILDAGCYCVGWTGSLWVAGGDGTTYAIAYSYDGINWTGVTSGLGGGRTFATNGRVSVVGGSSGIVYSTDGINWTNSATGFTLFGSGATCFSIAYSGTVWVAGGIGNTILAYSTDGIVWTEGPDQTLFDYACFTVAWNGSMWFAGGAFTPNTLLYSYDGIDWSSSTSGNAFFTYVSSIAWNGTVWLVAGTHNAASSLGYSPDGATWTVAPSASSFGAFWTLASRRVLPYVGYSTSGGPTGYTGPTGSGNTGATGPVGPTGTAGVTIQYGSGTTDGSFSLNVTFPTPFASAPNVTANVTDGTPSWVSIGYISSTGFTAYTWDIIGGLSADFNWLAIL
jgi:hypothetical protein